MALPKIAKKIYDFVVLQHRFQYCYPISILI